MSPVVVMTALWLLFAISHIGVVASPIRTALIRRLGRTPYLVAFVVVAQIQFAILPIYYATHRFDGPPGPALGEVPWIRPLLVVAIVVGLLLIVGSLAPAQYVSSSTTPFARTVRPAHGLERITRHPAFVGMGLWAGAHALLATHAVGTVFFGAFAALALLGTRHQDRKLVRERGPAYAEYVRTTSLVPFVAVLRGRQSLALREQPWLFLALGVVAVWLLRDQHHALLGWNGGGLALFFFVATSYFTIETARRARNQTNTSCP